MIKKNYWIYRCHFFFYRWSDCDMKCSTEIGTFNCLEFTYISYELCERSTYSKADNFCFDDLLNVSVYLSVSHCVFVCVLFYFLFHSQHCHFVASTRQKFQFTHAFLATMSLFLFYFLCFFKISFLSYLCINSFTFYVVQVFFISFSPSIEINICFFVVFSLICADLPETFNLLFSVWDWNVESLVSVTNRYKCLFLFIVCCFKNVCSTANNMSTIRSEFRHETETDSLWNSFGVCCVWL